MAKKESKARKQPQRRRATARQRPSARRAPRARISTRRPGPAIREAAAAAAAGERLQVTLGLHDVSGAAIRDPETFFTFRRL